MDKDQYNPRGYPDRQEPVRYVSAGAPTAQQPDQATKVAQNEHSPVRPGNCIYSATQPKRITTANSAIQLFPENIWRRSFMIHNATGATLYVKYGRNVTTMDFSFPVADGQMYEPMPGTAYAGEIWAVGANTGLVMTTDLS